MTNAPPLLHDRYRILGKLGESRLATVFRAQDERLKRAVLVHLLRPELIATYKERFTEEAQRGAQHGHPGLIEVYDTGEIGGRPYMITEAPTGVPLAERVPLPAGDAVAVLRTVVSAVALAQSQGAPHPPISSRNVWLLEGGRAVLIENWQLAPRAATLDLAAYRAPERMEGAKPGPATAVYALGILAWETLAGRRPFAGDTAEAIAQQQLGGALLPLSSVVPRLYAPELDRIIEQATASRPGMRYPTPTDFGRALDHLSDATSAQTGRLALLHPTAAPTPRIGRDTQTLSMPRVAASATPPSRPVAAAVPPPPPPALIQAPATRPRRTPVQPLAAPTDQKALGKEVQKVVRQELRRQSCQRSNSAA